MTHPKLGRILTGLLIAGLLLPFQSAPVKAQTPTQGYLIIAADVFIPTLTAFVDLKTSQGFQVSLTPISTIGSTKEEIKTYLQAFSPRPEYALLVGDTDFIPAWLSKIALGGATDLYYTTFDGDNDIQADIILGRLPVHDTAQLAAVIDKYITYDQLSPGASWRRKASFIVDDDRTNYLLGEAVHNEVMNTWTSPLGYSGTFTGREGATAPTLGGDRLYAVSYHANSEDLSAAFNAGRALVLYNGLGSTAEWDWNLDDAFGQADVAALTGPPIPLVFAVAQPTADLGPLPSISDAWLLHPSSGALVYIGSTNISVAAFDAYVERYFMKYVFTNPRDFPSVGQALRLALADVVKLFLPTTGLPTQYSEMYQILGDPSLELPDLYPYKYYFPWIPN